MAIKRLAVEITANTQKFSAGMAGVKAKLGEVEKATKKVGDAAKATGTGLTVLTASGKTIPKWSANIAGANTNLLALNTTSKQSASASAAAGAGFMAFAAKAAIVVGAIMAVAKGISVLEKSYMSLESAVFRVNDIFRGSAVYIKDFATNTARSFGMSQRSAYEYAATYGNLFRSITANSKENAAVSIAMLKSSAVIASKTGRTVDDVMERIRSGLLGNTEAIEDLGVQVQVNMLKTTDAFKKIANGRSWEQLTFQEQQQIRVLGILEQAHTNFGDSVQKSSAFSLQTLSASFQDFTATLGGFVNAALVPVLEFLTRVVQRATDFVKIMARILGIEIKPPKLDETTSGITGATNATDALTEATKKAEKARQRLAGIDVINTLPSKTEASGSGAGAGGSGGIGGGSVFSGFNTDDSKEEEKSNSRLVKWKEKIANVTRGMKWTWDTLKKNTLQPIAATVLPAIHQNISKIKSKWDEIRKNTDLLELGRNIRTIWGAITKVAGQIGAAFAKAWAVVSDLGIDLFFAGLQGWIAGVTEGIGTIAAIINGDWSDAWTHVKNASKACFDLYSEQFEILKGAATRAKKWLTDKFSEAWADIKAGIKSWWDNSVAPWFTIQKWLGILENIGAGFAISLAHFRDIWNTKIKFWWDNGVVAWFTLTRWKNLYNNIKAALTAKLDETKTAAGTKLSDFWNKTIAPWFTVEKWKQLGTNMKDGLVAGFKGVIRKTIDIMNGAITGMNNAIKGILTPINSLIHGYNGAAAALRLPIINPVPIPVFNTLSYPQGFGGGGIINSPTKATLAEFGPEAVVPLAENSAWIDRLARVINAKTSGGGSGDTYFEADIYLGDGTFIDHISKKLERRARQKGALA